MPHSFSYAVSMNLEHSIKKESHERYPVHLHCLRKIKKIKYADFQAMTLINCYIMDIVATQHFCKKLAVLLLSSLFSDLTFNCKSMCYTEQMCYAQRILTCIHHQSCQLEGNTQKF